MNWIMLALVLIPTSLLLAQAISCLRRIDVHGHMRAFGLLSLWLWGFSIVLGILFLSGTLVLSLELGIVMVQGTWARFGIGTGARGRCRECRHGFACMPLAGWTAKPLAVAAGRWRAGGNMRCLTAAQPLPERFAAPTHLCIRPLVATLTRLVESVSS